MSGFSSSRVKVPCQSRGDRRRELTRSRPPSCGQGRAVREAPNSKASTLRCALSPRLYREGQCHYPRGHGSRTSAQTAVLRATPSNTLPVQTVRSSTKRDLLPPAPTSVTFTHVCCFSYRCGGRRPARCPRPALRPPHSGPCASYARRAARQSFYRGVAPSSELPVLLHGPEPVSREPESFPTGLPALRA